ncbi:Phenylacetic acid catabolic protein, partial [Conyzicola sp.]|uniref:1,2-phenylacetyl-CoA epoxidase subunit PaaC n=1 Tax=Conyzicola sp. TaxID=1969404 RepID=UPI003988D29A
MSPFNDAEQAVLLAFADDEHVMGQRHTEWIGVAPFLEEDLAFASIGQDELGHAALLYELLAEGDADQLAFWRSPSEYRSCWLVEMACTDWADALMRHWLYDEAELVRWVSLATSSAPELRGIAARALAEEV